MPKTAIYAVAIGAIFCALGGFYYHAINFAIYQGIMDDLPGDTKLYENEKVFHRVFVLMSVVNCTLHSALLVTGVMLLRLRLQWTLVLIGLFVLDILYIIGIGALWMVPDIELEVAGATAIANAGFVLKWMILFPLWGSLLLLWGKSRISTCLLPPPLPDASA